MSKTNKTSQRTALENKYRTFEGLRNALTTAARYFGNAATIGNAESMVKQVTDAIRADLDNIGHNCAVVIL